MSIRALFMNSRIYAATLPILLKLSKIPGRLRYIGIPVLDANERIRSAVSNGEPMAIGKIGAIELRGLLRYIKRSRQSSRNSKPCPYSAYERYSLYCNAGVFPPEDLMFDHFALLLSEAIGQMDALGVWYKVREIKVFRRYCPNAVLIQMRSLEPYFYAYPWSAALAGKKVLVISPFIQTISNQYAKRDLVWANPDVLPSFSLVILKAPLSAALAPPEHPTWDLALSDLKRQMNSIEYDVAIIGAGAFSIPLAVHAKKSGKIGIHMGGATQILFGIRGRRWDNHPDFQDFVNANWCRPNPEETPLSANKVEDACYW